MERRHLSLWLDADLVKKGDANKALTGAKTRSDYIEDALEFYDGFLHGKDYEKYISKTMVQSFQNTIDSCERRLARLLFKQAVEIAKVFWLVVRGFKLNPGDVDDLHLDCIEEVKSINGAIRYPYRNKGDDV